MTEPIKIAILNDYELVVAGIRRMLEPYGARVKVVETVVGSAEIDRDVDVALYDTFGRVDVGVNRLSSLVANPHVGHVVVYTTSMPAEATRQLLELGVSGCLSKSLSAIDLVRSLERVNRGEVTIAMRSSGGPSDFSSPDLKLSYRESEVLALLSQGLRNRAIAKALYVGEETVKSHLKSIYRKLGVSSRGEAIAVAFRDPSFAEPKPLDEDVDENGNA
jgi:DNA-binding NarL/FixJ family response regulator